MSPDEQKVPDALGALSLALTTVQIARDQNLPWYEAAQHALDVCYWVSQAQQNWTPPSERFSGSYLSQDLPRNYVDQLIDYVRSVAEPNPGSDARKLLDRLGIGWDVASAPERAAGNDGARLAELDAMMAQVNRELAKVRGCKVGERLHMVLPRLVDYWNSTSRSNIG